MPDLIKTSSKSPKELFQTCKAILDEHLERFLLVGEALLIIRDQKLYLPEVAGKDGAKSLSAFLDKNYRSRVRAMQMLGAAETRQILQDHLGLKDADDLWTCEYHYSQINSVVHPLLKDGELTAQGQGVLKKFEAVDRRKYQGELLKAKYEAILTAKSLPILTEVEREASAIHTVRTIPQTLKGKTDSILEDVDKLPDNNELKNQIADALKASQAAFSPVEDALQKRIDERIQSMPGYQPQMLKTPDLPEPYYKDEFITLYHGSSREIMPLLAPASFDLVLTDPPFGIDHHDAAGHTILNDDNLDWLPDAVKHMATLLKYKGHFYCFSSYNFIDVFIREIKKHLSYRYLLIWDKGSAASSRGMRTAYAEQYETIIMAVKGVMRHLKFSARPSSIIKCPRVTEKNRIHQHEKPAKLIADIVSMNVYGLEAPEVIDPFAGSGVVGSVCKRLGVPCVLIELDERHCRAIKERLTKTKTGLNLPDIAKVKAFREEQDGKPPKQKRLSPKRKKELERMKLDAEEQAKRILEESKAKRGLK